MWLDEMNQPWFGIQVTDGYSVASKVLLTKYFGDNRSEYPVYFFIFNRAPGTRPLESFTNRGVSVLWKNSSIKPVLLRISIGYVPPMDTENTLPAGFAFASHKCHISLASEEKPARNPVMVAKMMEKMQAKTAETAQSNGSQAGDGIHSTVSPVAPMPVHQPATADEEVELAGLLTFEIDKFFNPDKEYGQDEKAPEVLSDTDRRALALFYDDGSGWVAAPDVSWDVNRTMVTIGASDDSKTIPMGMYIFGLPK